MNILRLMSISVVLMLLSGCAGLVKSNVSVFHVLPEKAEPTKYAFLPVEGQRGSLEYESYKGLVRTELSKYQYEETSISEATVIIAFNYVIGDGKVKVSSVPTYGQTGVSSSTTYGTVSTYGNYGTYSGTTTYTPTYGVTGSQAVSRTAYTRKVWLHIVDKASLESNEPKKLYEASVVSEGSSSQIAKVMPALIKAIFKKFPGKSGSTRKEIIPLSQ